MKKDKQDQQEKAKKLKLNKETLGDIRPGEKGKDVRGGDRPGDPAKGRSYGAAACVDAATYRGCVG
jgi:hypothetical protein